MTQQEIIARFIEETKLKMNPELFKRSNDEIIDQLKQAIKSCERNGQHFSIKVEGFTVVDDYAEVRKILYNYYERSSRNKTKAKKKDNRYEFINLNDSDIRLLIVHYLISDKESTAKLDVIIAVPLIIDNYYFRIDGIMRSTLYQVVDGSTYNNSTSQSKNPSITMKLVFMAVRVFRKYMELPVVDSYGNKSTITGTHYTAFSFNKTVNAMKYILAKYGLEGTMARYGLTNIYIRNQPTGKSDWYDIDVGSGTMWICVPKIFFDNDLMTQALICTIYDGIYPQISINEFYNDTYWVRSLGADFNKISRDKFIELILLGDKSGVNDTLAKGYNILDSFEGIYDECTKNNIKLPEDAKANMYNVLVWMLREYNNLRLKDNLDISIKRIRFAEYIASLYIMKIAKGIYRVADKNKRATVEDIIRAIKTDPLYLLKSIVMSKMVSYRNMVSDMDSMQALKFTYKGVSGLGENGNKSIPDIYRAIQPSHIGRVDIDASSDGNPGISGTLNPYMKMHNGFFSDYDEPDTWEKSYAEIVEEFNSNNKLISALDFQQRLLGIDRHEEIEVLEDISASMQQIINPIYYNLQQGLIFMD